MHRADRVQRRQHVGRAVAQRAFVAVELARFGQGFVVGGGPGFGRGVEIA